MKAETFRFFFFFFFKGPLTNLAPPPQNPKALELWHYPSPFQFLVFYLPFKTALHVYSNLLYYSIK